MRKVGKIVSLLLLLGCVCQPAAFGQRCGVERWAVKTGTDGGAGQVALASPQASTIADLIALAAPNPLPTDSRFDPSENTVFVLNATLTDFKLEGGAHGDSDYHLVLMDDQGNTMVAEIPSPDCVGTGIPFAAQIANARSEFDSQFTATASFQTANVPVQLTGVGFFDFFHNQHGAAPNVVELHPVLDIQFNPQPNSADFSLSSSTTAVALHKGGSSSINIAAVPLAGGKVSTISFTASGLPAGVTSHITPGSDGKAVMSLSATSAVPNGTFPVIVTGSSKGKTHSQTIALNLSGPPEPPVNLEWEYKTISAISEQDVINQANQLGSQDWEMVSVVRVTGSPGWRVFQENKEGLI